MNAPKFSEHPPSEGKLSKYLGGNIGCRDKSATEHGVERVLQCSHIGSTVYNIWEKPTVIFYTDINHHVGTPKQIQIKRLSGEATRYTVCNINHLTGTPKQKQRIKMVKLTTM